MLSVYTVTNTEDGGIGSLRDAIDTINLDSIGANEIDFNIPGSGVHTIAPLSALPAFVVPIFVNGYSQPGSSPNTRTVGDDAVLGIELSGASLSQGEPGLSLDSNGNTISGLVIDRFPGMPISMTGGSQVIRGNFLGLDPSGLAAALNGDSLELTGDNTIGGTTPAARNLILNGVSNFAIGIEASDFPNNLIQGNYLGTDRTGNVLLKSSVIDIASAFNTVGGAVVGAGNVIAGSISVREGSAQKNLFQGNNLGVTAGGDSNFGAGVGGLTILRSSGNTVGGTTAMARNLVGPGGITILGAGGKATGNLVEGNYIGVGASGSTQVGDFNSIGVTITAATDNTVGGTVSGAGNVIGGMSFGIAINGEGASRNVVQGNLIGTNAAGTISIANQQAGVAIASDVKAVTLSASNVIGGTSVAARNVISGNLGTGVVINNATLNVVEGNYIGVAADGTSLLGNGTGITIDGVGNTIGGPSAAFANIIAGNTGLGGVAVLSGTGNAILSNAIYQNFQPANKQLGIDLGGDGITPNDSGDGDTGANNLQNSPFLKGAAVSGATVNVSGTIDTQAGTYTLQFFDNALRDPSGFGEGQRFLTQIMIVVTAPAAPVDFTVTFPTSALLGGQISATATDPKGNTSEFSNDLGLFTVINTDDSGFGSLQQAILNANAVTGTDTIDFNIAGTGVQTISPQTVLPTITDSVVIDGYTQPGASPNTNGPTFGDNARILVEIDGSALPNGSNGLVVTGGSTTIRGLAIYGFLVGSDPLTGSAVVFQGGSGDVLDGVFLGLDATGTIARSNNRGVLVFQSPNDTIGGATNAARNLISGNRGIGVDIFQTQGTLIAGNRIGLAADGATGIGNGSTGIFLDSATLVTVGGLTAGERNVIAANNQGISIAGSQSSIANLVIGNYVGTESTGKVAVGNLLEGILLAEGASNNTIGGTAAGAGNLVSGNLTSGVRVLGSISSTNFILGNLIGTDVTGNAALGNAFDGVQLDGAAQITIGGTAPGSRNVISGNGRVGVDLVVIEATGPSGSNLIIGNAIGVGLDGKTPLGNGAYGVALRSGALNNTIGGGNVISGNGFTAVGGPYAGVNLGDTGTSGNLVAGNFIGTDVAGLSAVANAADGVVIAGGASGNTIGGTGPGYRNVISGNAASGVVLENPGTASNVVLGNFIGVDLTGSIALGNGGTGSAIGHGVLIFDGAAANTVGGASSAAANVLSASHNGDGVFVAGGTPANPTRDNLIQGNFLGTDATGSSALGNDLRGVEVADAMDTSIVGNLISANKAEGIIVYSGASQTLIQGNTIGLDATGTDRLGNASFGIRLAIGASGTLIGGNQLGQGNVISANGQAGIDLDGSSSPPDTTLILGNDIGVARDRLTPRGNSGPGIQVNGATNTTVGGTAPVATPNAPGRNIIGGNLGAGVSIAGAIVGLNLTGNYLGVSADGKTPLPNGTFGVVVENSSSLAVSGNLISANPSGGVHLTGPMASSIGLQGNIIGLAADGKTALGNGGPGIFIDGFAARNIIGGSTSGAGNVISGNALDGVHLFNATGTSILGNRIGTTGDGTAIAANRAAGIEVENSSHTTIGGSASADGNLISGNGQFGVYVHGSNALDTVVQGNFIGTVAVHSLGLKVADEDTIPSS
ncbi:MAG: Na-Ca exchanger/integrin-beta4 [Planctomycetota bacterium]|nr:Na-Ca exchanger/integrin-beta4 [Planctomycetota bacterium]